MSNSIIKPEIIDLSSLNSQETGFSLTELKQIVYRRWKPALAVSIVAFTGLFLKTVLETPEYLSETQILLENQKNQEAADVAPSQTAASQFYSMQDLSTEILVLRSNSLVAKALATLKSRYPDLSASQVLENLSINQAIVNKIPTDILVVSYTDTDPQRAKDVLEVLGSTYVKYSLDKQRSQASNAIGFINAQLPGAQQELDQAAKEIRQFRQVNQLVDPESSAVTAAGVKQELEQQIQATKLAINLNRKQSQELNRQLGDLGQDSETMVASSVLGQDGVYQNLASQLKDTETQYNLGKVDFRDNYHVMINLKERRAELKKLLQERAEQVLGKSVSPQILDRIVLSQNNTTSTASTADSSIAGADSVDSSNSTDSSATGNSAFKTNSTNSSTTGTSTTESGTKVSSEGSTLGVFANRQLELQTEAASLQSQLASLSQAKTQAETNFENIPRLQQAFTELQRQLELKSEAYNYLLERRQELEISEAEETAPWRVLNEAFLPNTPVSPNIQQGLVQALIAGGFLGVATAFILQQLDQRVKQVEEIKQITRLPLLGVIPKVDDPTIDINIHTTKKSYSYYSSFTEGLRSLAMNLRYLMAEDGRIQTLAITSSTSAEGKSTIAHNLGIVLAEFDLRVLIVDADMRKPKIHKLAQIPNETGLSDAITKEEPWADFVQTSIVENLDIITSGATSPNPIALLNSDKMKQLIEEWQAAYDYVIIDTPPIGVIADAKSLANQVDSVLFVAGIQRTSRKALSNAMDILRSSQCNIAGVVANLVDPEFDYYAYSYYDSYYNDSAENRDGDGHEDESQGKIQNILQQFRRR